VAKAAQMAKLCRQSCQEVKPNQWEVSHIETFVAILRAMQK
jgi:hypothetical protein